MKTRLHTRVAPAVLTALTLAGCALGPDYRRPDVTLPPAYAADAAAVPAAGAPTTVSPTWWRLFGDPQLDTLVDTALARNADLLQAVARVEQAEALVRQANAAQWPSLDLGANAARGRTSGATGLPGGGTVGNNFRLAASTSFELDFWGRLRRASEAARAEALASGYAGEVVRQTVAGLVAQAYFSLRMLDEQIVLTRETLKTREEAVRLLGVRLQGGASGRLDVDQAESLRADAALQLRELERQRSLAQSQLGLLTAQPGLELAGGRLQTLPLPPVPPAGLPSELLARRPDVRQAEQQLVSANAQIGVAKAAMFPQLSLTGLAGGESAELSDLLKSGARIWSVGFGLTLPLFDAGRRAAQTEQAEARQREVVAAYQGAVHSAFKDVADALANLRAARESQADVEASEKAALRALQVAQQRYDVGYSAYLELLDAQRTANTARLRTVDNRQAQLAATVAVFKALGGGWVDPVVAASQP
ncbi:efflux transporter outer membrane subunit [Caldimonas brevitalea]|uniref:Outer membrane protein, multidrug efflux system n=1 Tax=Caldimonas brevitalea TaxID=413882 RepID=A0A0G3BZ49_9BURK|nr:efflux transporter outer membrane subunit [Caldimonas brevitalea]AKJ31760.1 outer membrane protein, multidrug efflux system [Caldimonas brevitalea]